MQRVQVEEERRDPGQNRAEDQPIADRRKEGAERMEDREVLARIGEPVDEERERLRQLEGDHNLRVAKKVRTVAKINHRSGRAHRLRYDAVFLDMDSTLLWVHLDIEGWLEDLSPYTTNASLTAERATEPAWEIFNRHIREYLKYRTKDDLADFKRRNCERSARELGIVAPHGGTDGSGGT